MGQRLERVEGVVYCLIHGEIHERSRDPHQTGEIECYWGEHRTVYWRTRKEDIENRETDA